MNTFGNVPPHTRSGSFNPRALIVSSGCALLLLAIAMPWEEATAASPTQASRPKIGLALGGGGARGAAHVGVLKVLEELRIPIDYIAGTSMGAIVGGLYAAGYSPEEIEEIVETIDWDRIVSDRPPRERLTFRRKQEDFNLLVKFEIGFRNGKFRTPEAIIQGALLDGTLRWFALRAHNITDFDGLPIPYRAIAADIDTGEMVVLDRGNLGVAMRASSSIAGVFTPVQVEGRFLVDGGIVRNLPIDVVRGMGADIVIAVDVGSPLRIVSEGLVGVADQVLRMITRRNADEQIKQLRDEDVLIQVALDDIGAMQFGRAAEAALIGEVAARRRASVLARYRVPEDQYRTFIRRQRVTPWSPPQVDYIRIDNNSPVNPDAVKARMTLKPGDVLDKQSLERDLERIYGMGDFEYVSFLLVQDEDLIGLIVETRGKSWGPNYLRFGFNLEGDFDGNNQFSIIADFTKRPVNRLGAEWKNQLSVGEFRGIRSEFYQPLAASGRWFVAPQLEIVESGDEVGEGETRTRSAIVDLGVNLGKVCCELRVGAVASDVNASGRIGFLQPPTSEGDLGAYQVNFTYDLLDNIAFPRHGSSVGLGGFYARRDVNDSDFEYDRTRLDWATAGSVRRHTFIGFASLGSSGTSTLPPFAEFSLGGFLNLSGLKPNELRGQYFGVLRFIYYFRLKRLGFGHALYVGGSLEAGNVWDDRDDVFDDNIAAGSVFFGADTIVGPLYAAYGSAEDDRNAFYLFLGRVFRLD